jgi:Protein of unknown function (DUF4239)
MSVVTQIGIVIGVVALAIVLLWLARRSPFNERFANEVVEHDHAFDFLGIAFAVLLAFVVIEAYDSYNEARKGAEIEAEAVLELSRTAEAFGPDSHKHLEGLLVCYGRAVIHHGFPAMREGEESDVVDDWGTRFRDATRKVAPQSFIQRASFRQLLTEQDLRIEGRRTRLAEAIRIVPPPLWVVLLMGAALTIGWVVVSANRTGSFLVQSAVVASVAAMVVAALLLVWFLDHPFADEPGSITPIEMENVLEVIAEENEFQGVEVSAPCNESGDPGAV